MEKELVISISPYVQKYYFNQAYIDLPNEIKDELRAKISLIAEKINCIISLGFDQDSELFIEERHEEGILYDDIGAALEIKAFQSKEEELLKALKMWHMIYRTKYGQIVKDVVILQANKLTNDEILDTIEKKYGIEARDFTKTLLEA